MFRNLLLSSIAFSTLQAFAQQTTHSWDFDGLTREYIQYVPGVYDGSEAVPLVLALHGLGDNMSNFSGVGFQYVADTANFIVVYPQALVDQLITGQAAWNSGAGVLGISLNSDVDDVGFLNALMDTVSAHYNIDQSRIYVTGFSMGGFMSNRLACELNNRVSAVASVAGTVGGEFSCSPGQPVRVCHFHGTADTQVGYGMTAGGVQNNNFGSNVDDWIGFWTANNGCGNVTLEGTFPNTANDGYTVDYKEFAGCSNNSRVVHYRVNGANHVWLAPNNDIFYTTEIWKFFLGLSPINLSLASVEEGNATSFNIYPNPVQNELSITDLNGIGIEHLAIFDASGRLVKSFGATVAKLDVSDLESGTYMLNVTTETGSFCHAFVKD
jgi:polyhydroxybutyrate depolymerase